MGGDVDFLYCPGSLTAGVYTHAPIMNGFYQQRQQFSGDNGGSQQQYGHGHGHGQRQENGQNMMQLNMGGGMSTSIPGASSLDDIVNQNHKNLLFRRRSMPIPSFGQQHTHAQQISPPTQAERDDNEDEMRRASLVDMMDFGGNNPTMGTYTFDPSAFDTSMLDMSTHQNQGQGHMNRGQNNLSIDTNARFQVPQSGYGQQSAGFGSAMSGQNDFGAGMESPYLTSAFPQQSMGNEMGMMQADMPVQGTMFNTEQFNSPMANSPMHASYTPSMLGPNLQDPGGGGNAPSVSQSRTPQTNASDGTPLSATNQPSQRQRHASTRTNSNEQQPVSVSEPRGLPREDSNASTQTGSIVQQRDVSNFNPEKMIVNPKGGASPELINGNALPWSAPPNGWPNNMGGRTHMNTQFKDAYAPSGYDLMSILVRIFSSTPPTKRSTGSATSLIHHTDQSSLPPQPSNKHRLRRPFLRLRRLQYLRPRLPHRIRLRILRTSNRLQPPRNHRPELPLPPIPRRQSHNGHKTQILRR